MPETVDFPREPSRLGRRIRLAVVVGVAVVGSSPLWVIRGAAVSAQQPGPFESTPMSTGTGGATPTGAPRAPQRTEAERIVGLRRLVDDDRRQKANLEEEEGRLRAQFDGAAADFERLDTQLSTERSRLGSATDPAHSAALAQIQTEWSAARDRFNAIIQRRKAVQAETRTLADKLALEQQILDGMTVYPTPGASTTGVTTPPSPSAPPAHSSTPPAPEATQAVASPNPAPAPSEELLQLDDDVEKARKEQAATQSALRSAEARVTRLDNGIDIFQRDLVSSRRLLDAARKEFAAADQALRSLDAQIERKRAAGAAEAALSDLQERRKPLEDDVTRTREEFERQNSRVEKSETTVEQLKTSRADAVERLRTATAEARSARNALLFYESPLAPHRVRWWLTVKGPRVLAVLAAMAAIWWLARVAGRRLVAGVVRRGRRGTQAERDGRAETVRRAFQSGASAAIVVLGLLAVLHQAGIDVTVLLGGTAVVGAAIAFGSQNMVHDYFGGFMILLENQYSVGNVIRIGNITGTVEGLTLRMTSLRDLEGVLHFIPHSQVSQVSNLTYGWSRIVVDIRVAPGENVDRAMNVLMQVAHGLARDPEFGPQLVGEPEMLGVDSITGLGVVIKLLVKTQPLRRWAVKRELLLRIKRTFDAQTIRVA